MRRRRRPTSDPPILTVGANRVDAAAPFAVGLERRERGKEIDRAEQHASSPSDGLASDGDVGTSGHALRCAAARSISAHHSAVRAPRRSRQSSCRMRTAHGQSRQHAGPDEPDCDEKARTRCSTANSNVHLVVDHDTVGLEPESPESLGAVAIGKQQQDHRALREQSRCFSRRRSSRVVDRARLSRLRERGGRAACETNAGDHAAESASRLHRARGGPCRCPAESRAALRRASTRHAPPAVHQRHHADGVCHDAGIVRREDERHAVTVAQVAHQVHQRLGILAVEVRGRLVGQHQSSGARPPRARRPRAAAGRPTARSMRRSARSPRPSSLEHLECARACRSAPSPCSSRTNSTFSTRRQNRHEVVGLEHEANRVQAQVGALALGQRRNRPAEHRQLSAGRHVERPEQIEQRRLAAARRPDQRQELAATDLEIHAAQRPDRAARPVSNAFVSPRARTMRSAHWPPASATAGSVRAAIPRRIERRDDRRANRHGAARTAQSTSRSRRR